MYILNSYVAGWALSKSSPWLIMDAPSANAGYPVPHVDLIKSSMLYIEDMDTVLDAPVWRENKQELCNLTIQGEWRIATLQFKGER